MQVWFSDVIWSQGALLHLPPRRAENSPDPQDGLGRVSYFHSANWPPIIYGCPFSIFLCTSKRTSRNWWTQAAGYHCWIPCRCWNSRTQLRHWILAVISSWGSILRYLYICYSCMNSGHVWYTEHVWYTLCCLPHVRVSKNRDFLKSILNKATYCERISSVLWCFHWLPLRF